MFEALHRASYTVGTGDEAKTEYVTTTVKWPESLEDLAELCDNPQNYPELSKILTETCEITVGYKKVGDKWERVYKTLPYVVAMAIEGMKLDLNTKVRPKPTEAGVTEEDVKAFEEATKEPNAVLLWQLGNAKVKKALREKVLAWKSEQK
jgi:hypothetical protein